MILLITLLLFLILSKIKVIIYFSPLDLLTDVDLVKKQFVKKDLVQFTLKDDENIFFGNLDENDLKWDQFEINKKKFNVETSYDENHYTTELIYNQIPQNIVQKAERIMDVRDKYLTLGYNERT